jgi:pilus assembly protein CpaE
MLRAIIIGAEPDLAGKLEQAFEQSERFVSLRSIERYPSGQEEARIVRAYAPQVVFLCTDKLEEALRVAAAIEKTVVGVPLVAFGRDPHPQTLLQLMKAGIREYLPLPFDIRWLVELADRTQEQLEKNPLSFEFTDLLFSFLPAKAGVGSSTLALNMAVAFSRQPETKVLLADFDLNSGLIAFMLKVTSPYTLNNVVEMSADMDDSLWAQFVREKGSLHVLPAGRPDPGSHIQPAQIQRLLAFARRLYQVICVDLSGNLEKYSIELMQESKRVFLVTTPEIPPLHLARERLTLLRHLDLGDRVSVLVNRFHRSSAISVAQIQDILDAPVYATFSNNYRSVHQSLVEGRPLDEQSELGRQVLAMARRILNPDGPRPQPRKRRFLEHFALLPAKYSLRRE